MALKWYAIQTYAGSEMSVKNAIETLAKENNIEEKIQQVLVPTEDVIEMKNGKQVIKERSLYPGYCFAYLDLDTPLWHRIQLLPKVSRFIGEAKRPASLSEADIELILEIVENDDLLEDMKYNIRKIKNGIDTKVLEETILEESVQKCS